MVRQAGEPKRKQDAGLKEELTDGRKDLDSTTDLVAGDLRMQPQSGTSRKSALGEPKYLPQ